MQKQHYTTKISGLVSPPLLSHMEQLQLNCKENVYASRKNPLGRGKPPDIPKEAKDKCFGKVSEDGDHADSLMYPSDSRVHSSLYGYDFLPPESFLCGNIATAGVSNHYIGDHANSSERIKAIFNEEFISNSGCDLKRKKETEYEKSFRIHPTEKYCERKKQQKSFYSSLKNLFNMDDELYKKFYYFARYQLENCKVISASDFQEVILNFGFCASSSKLERLLSEYNLSVNGAVDVQKLCDALNWRSPLSESLENKISRFLKGKQRLFGDDHPFHNCFEGSKDLNQDLQQPAGLPPQIHYPCIIQPTIFERYGIFDEDLNEPRCKHEIISILHKSGMCFKTEMLDLIWEKLNRSGKACIGDVWKAMKHLYLSY